MAMDSLMLGSLTMYRRVLQENVFTPNMIRRFNSYGLPVSEAVAERAHVKLPTVGHGLAGVMAGWTVSFIAAPVEHVKARLQIQYAADKSKRLYSGPIDCSRKIVCIFVTSTFWA
jgi:solute carrier family 25 carnitine/acylcarnitine transporter 20/29